MLLALTHWTWWLLAAVLVAVEIIAPGVFFLWLGIAAGIVGAALLFAPGLSWQLQLLLFAVCALGSIFLSRKFLQRGNAPPDPSERARRYIGMTVTVEEAIRGGFGKVRVEDTVWRARGADAEAGARVKITAIDGVTFVVEEAS